MWSGAQKEQRGEERAPSSPLATSVPLHVLPLFALALKLHTYEHILTPILTPTLIFTRASPSSFRAPISFSPSFSCTNQVCLRWTLQRGVAIAAGTGADPATAPQYARENLDVFKFSLADTDMVVLNNMQL